MKIILARHGETNENREGIIMGHLHGTLSEKGILQAEELAKQLKNERIDEIYSSNLNRAFDTAKIVAKEHPHLKTKPVDDLRERFLGKFQGKRKADFGMSKDDSIAKIKEETVESSQDFFERAKKFLKKLLLEYQNKTVLRVSHNGISKAMISVITNKKPEDIEYLENLPNAGFKVFEFNDLPKS